MRTVSKRSQLRPRRAGSYFAVPSRRYSRLYVRTSVILPNCCLSEVFRDTLSSLQAKERMSQYSRIKQKLGNSSKTKVRKEKKKNPYWPKNTQNCDSSHRRLKTKNVRLTKAGLLVDGETKFTCSACYFTTRTGKPKLNDYLVTKSPFCRSLFVLKNHFFLFQLT